MGRRGRPPYPDILTPREWDVLGLVREGLSNPQIADRLGIGRETVKHHVSEILSKLGVSSREEAALWQPEERRPWWTAALVPLAVTWRRVSAILSIRASWAAAVAAGVVFLVVICGLGLMAFLLLRGDGRGFEVVSVNNDGDLGSGNSYGPSISADGRYIAFESLADNLVPGDTNDSMDVFVHDRETGKTELVSVSVTGTFPNAESGFPAISGDGRYVAFGSGATDLVPEEIPSRGQVFVRDRLRGVTELASVSSSGAVGDDWSDYPAISPDGRFVVFASLAGNLAEGAQEERNQMFIRDRELGTTELIPVNGSVGSIYGGPPAISSDARFIAFVSGEDGLVPEDANGADDVLVFDRSSGTVERVSEAAGGGDTDHWSLFPTMSADGRFVTFYSMASNLVPGVVRKGCSVGITDLPYPEDTCPGMYVRDRATGRIEEISLVTPSRHVWGMPWPPSMSADGRYVAFVPSVVWEPEEQPAQEPDEIVLEILVRDREQATTNRLPVLTYIDLSGGVDDYRPALSANGGSLAFSSFGMRLLPEEAVVGRQIFVVDLSR